MNGKRMPEDYQIHRLAPGEYAAVNCDGGVRCFFACSPDGRLANLAQHTVIEHEDGTISVSPSILVRGGGDDGEWHGYLERGIWREC